MPFFECIFVQRRENRALPRFVQISKGHAKGDLVKRMFLGESLLVSFAILRNGISVRAASELDEKEPIDPTAGTSDHQIGVVLV